MKLHVGCGKRYIKGFVHLDIAEYDHIDHHAPLDKLPFEDETVDLIYCCHALTYYDREGIQKVLHEWLRVLKPGGIARISVTDFSALIRIYQVGGIARILGPLFGRWEVTEGKNQFIYHKTVFDAASLKNMMIITGFNDVTFWDWRTTEHSNVDDYSQAYYPHMDKSNGIQVSLNMEGIK